jgi:hypothetical protein
MMCHARVDGYAARSRHATQITPRLPASLLIPGGE